MKTALKIFNLSVIYFLVCNNLAVICLQGDVTSVYDEYGNVSRVVELYESANGIIMKLDNLLTPPMPAVSRPAVCNKIYIAKLFSHFHSLLVMICWRIDVMMT